MPEPIALQGVRHTGSSLEKRGKTPVARAFNYNIVRIYPPFPRVKGQPSEDGENMILRLLVICAVAAAFLFMFQAWQDGADAVELFNRVEEFFSK